MTISLISSLSTSFSSIGFTGASLTSTSKCSAHLSSRAFLFFYYLILLVLDCKNLLILLVCDFPGCSVQFSGSSLLSILFASHPIFSSQILLSSLALRLTSLSFSVYSNRSLLFILSNFLLCIFCHWSIAFQVFSLNHCLLFFFTRPDTFSAVSVYTFSTCIQSSLIFSSTSSTSKEWLDSFKTNNFWFWHTHSGPVTNKLSQI